MKSKSDVTVILKEYPDLKKCGVTSRFYRNGYENIDEEIAANLYSWLHQSFYILWDTDASKNEICIYSKTVIKLAERFATLLRKDKAESIHIWFELIKIIGMIELELKCSAKFSSLSKERNENWILLSAQEICKNHEGLIYLNRFVKMFGNHVHD